MIEGKLSLKLVMNLVNVKASEFICDVITLFEGVGRVVSFDKLAESSALIRIGAVDLVLIGGSGGVVRVEFIMDNVKPLSRFNDLLNTFKKLLSLLPSGGETLKNLELISSYETYIPLTNTPDYKSANISKVLSGFGISVNEVNFESLDGAGLLTASGTYVVGGLGAVKIIHTTLSRNYAVRSSLTMSKNVSISDINDQTIKKLLYETQILFQVVNEELFNSSYIKFIYK
ncbi:MAG: hypothetical protein QXT01_05725 [Sulfolobales archaeon]